MKRPSNPIYVTVAREVSVSRLSLRGTFERTETTLAKATGISVDRLLGARFTDLLVLNDRAAANSAIEAVLVQGEVRRFQSHLLVSGAQAVRVGVALAPIREGIGVTGAMMILTVQRNEGGEDNSSASARHPEIQQPA